jgi:hypothetical protein
MPTDRLITVNFQYCVLSIAHTLSVLGKNMGFLQISLNTAKTS